MSSIEILLIIGFCLANFLIIAAFILGKKLPIRRFKQPSCRSCGYPVTGLESFTCPECGKDLRQVGINTRNNSAFRKPIALWLLWFFWTVFVISATVMPIYLINSFTAPFVQNINQSVVLLQPKSGAYDHIIITVIANGFQWRWQQNMTWNKPPNKYGDTGSTNIKIYIHPGSEEPPAAIINFDTDTGYAITHSGAGTTEKFPPGSVFQGILKTFRQAGIDTNLPSINQEVKVIFSSISIPGMLDYTITGWLSLPSPAFASSSVLSSVYYTERVQWFQYVLWIVPVIIWMIGMIHLKNRRKTNTYLHNELTAEQS